MAKNFIYALLDRFIRRYYINQLIKGAILFVAIGVGIFMVVSFLVGISYLDTTVRTILFYLLVGAELLIIYKFFFIPIGGLLKFRNALNYKQASVIVGKHFSEVQDKLYNLLELQEGQPIDPLVIASIEQRINQLSPIPFHSAIDLSQNKRFLPYAIPTLAFFVFVVFSGYFSNLLEGSKRLAQHRTKILPVAPFSFSIVDTGIAIVGQPYTLTFLVTGDVVPQEAFVILNGTRFPLKKEGAFFTHELSRVNETVNVSILTDEFQFGPFIVIPKTAPRLSNFRISFDFPQYTGLSELSKTQFDNFSIPEGTAISFELETSFANEINFSFDDTIYTHEVIDNKVRHGISVTKNTSYGIDLIATNGLVEQGEQYFITVIKDAFPKITADIMLDTNLFSGAFIDVTIEDDYGFTSLFWELKKGETRIGFGKIPSNLNTNFGRVQQTISFEGISKEMLSNATLRIGVVDNDRVNGPKTSYSQTVVIQPKSANDLRVQSMQNSDKIAADVGKQQEELEESLEKLRAKNEEILKKKQPNWEDKTVLKEVLKEQIAIREKLDQFKKNRQKQSGLDEEQKLFNEEILDKQKKIDALLDKLLTDEMKELMKEIEALMDELDKDELKEKLEALQLENSQLNDELERYLELLEQLNFEKALDELINELDDLEQQQDALKNDETLSNDEKRNQQDELKEKQQEIQEKLDGLAKKDQDLKQPNGFEKPDDEMKDAQKGMEKASEELQKGNNSKAKEEQQKAKDGVEKAKNSLLSFQSGMMQQQNVENMEDLRRILENLITLSTDQEELMISFSDISANSPEYIQLIKEQKVLQLNSAIIADSLYALSKRVVEIEPFINKEMKIIDKSFEKSLAAFSERQQGQGRAQQQYVMTSTNNLSLLLNDALDQMQKKQASMMEGNQNCQKPGQGKPNMESLKKMQQELAEQLGKMKGDQQGEGQKGKGESKSGMSKEVVEMMAKQEKIREQLKSLAQEQQGNAMNELIEKLKENEKDIANQNFDDAFYERQKEILSRLLESETAELKQKQDDKRIGETASKDINDFHNQIDSYLKKREQEIELIRYESPNFGIFYRGKQRFIQPTYR